MEAYNAVNGNHDLNGSTPSPAVITLTWDDVAGKWTAAGTKPYVTFSVMHEDQGTADFALTKTAGVAYARVGDTITYTITVTNTGDVDLFRSRAPRRDVQL